MNDNTKWESVAYDDLRHGDDVRLSHGGGTVLYGRVLNAAIEVLATRTTGGLNWWSSLGFSPERAVPERTLPTEPGVYVEASHYPAPGYVLYSLHEAGHWAHDGGGVKWHRADGESDLPDDLVRLVPVTEVEALQARLDAARGYVAHPGNWSTLDGRRAYILSLLDGTDS